MELVGGINAPFARMGGKRRLALRLIKHFPDDYSIYVEPFVGAGNIFFRLHKKEGVKYVLNDKDEMIATSLKGLRDEADYINKNFNRHLTRDEFIKIRDKPKKTALDYIQLIKTSYFSQARSYNPPRDGNIGTDFLKYADELKDVTILNTDFKSVINKYNTPHTFFYLDPPYESKAQRDYPDYVHPEQVLNEVKKIKGKFMLSYNDSPNIRSLFSDYFIHSIKTIYSATTHSPEKEVNEVVITNYKIDWNEKKGGAIPTDKSLYEKVKKEVYAQYSKPSAYRSGAVIKRYKDEGGEFKDTDDGRPLERWFKEGWTDVGHKDYPVYRPTKRVNSKTPLTIQEIDPQNLKKQIALKQEIKGHKNLPPFIKK